MPSTDMDKIELLDGKDELEKESMYPISPCEMLNRGLFGRKLPYI